MVESSQLVRVSAYAVCRRGVSILLAHQVSPGPACGMWTLPGGGVEFGEDPRDAVVREVQEETGCEVVLGALLDVHSGLFEVDEGSLQHVVRLLYETELVGDPQAVQLEEIDALRWHPCRSLPTNITAWAVLGAERSS